MIMEPRTTTTFTPSRVVAAVALSCAATFTAASAQQTGTTPAPTVKQLTAPQNKLDLSLSDGVSYSSSVAPLTDQDTDTVATLELTGMPDSFQPPPRRRYGRRRYNDSSHNPDGSNKYAFLAGVGASIPTGNLHKYDTPSYGVQVGAGRNFNKNFSLIAQFDYDHFGLQGNTINNQALLYDPTGSQGILGALDGNSHIWSFSLNPTYNFYTREGLGAYVVAGVGFYHKVTNFTLPEQVEYSDGFYIYQAVQNQNIDHYTSNAPGFSGGIGLTFKPSRFAGERFYAEARYVFVDNSQRQGLTLSNANTSFGASYTGTNFYPENSNRSNYIPIKVGIRF